MAFTETQHRVPRYRIPLDPLAASRVGLFLSVLLIIAAPLAIADSYSVLEHTISESGGQGVAGAWIMRTGVLVTSASVITMTLVAETWSRQTRRWLRVYAIGLVLLVVFPEAPWDLTSHSEMVASAHTGAGVIAAIGFGLGVYSVSATRSSATGTARWLDWTVMAALVFIPQAMLLTTYQGVLQRLMVAVGYVWLLTESYRVGLEHREASGPSR